jgi:hypothetical protein
MIKLGLLVVPCANVTYHEAVVSQLCNTLNHAIEALPGRFFARDIPGPLCGDRTDAPQQNTALDSRHVRSIEGLSGFIVAPAPARRLAFQPTRSNK